MKNNPSVWGDLLSWSPAECCYPASLRELIDIIRYAKLNGLKIRAAGSLHSMNYLCETAGIQIFTDKLNHVLSLEKGKEQSVTVEAGIKIHELLDILADEGLTLPNQGYILEQSIAGAIATATHGSGKTGTFCDFVEEIDLVDAEGTLHRLTPETDPHLFSAALVNLGCLGVVYAVKLRCKPLTRLHLSKVRGRLPETLEELPSLLAKYDHFMITLDPYSDRLVTWRFENTDRPVYFARWYHLRRAVSKIFAVLIMDYLYIPSFLMPFLISVYMLFSTFRSCVDYSHRLLSPADEGHYIEEEFAVPMEHFEQALAVTRRIINRFSKKGNRPVAVILLRFVEADRFGYLSPSHGRKCAYISLISLRKAGYEALFEEIENALYHFEGRPHWGKMHFLNTDVISMLYGNDFENFMAAVNELDPDGLFINRYSHLLLKGGNQGLE